MQLSKETPITELSALIEPLCIAHGIELVSVDRLFEPQGMAFRIIIDKVSNGPADKVGSGVSLSDCEVITREVSTLFDVYEEDLGPYRIEVSSPGLNRPLVKPSDYERFAGQTIALSTLEPVRERKNFRGQLLGFKDGQININVDGQEFSVPINQVKKAHVVYPFSQKKDASKRR
jgi:ribosome maturation factor RimP